MTPTPKHTPRAIIFDVDKTLTPVTAWYELARHLDADTAKHAELYIGYKHGDLEYDHARQELMKVFGMPDRPVTRQELEDFFLTMPVRGTAIATIRELREKGYHICLISSSISLYVELTASKFGIDDWYGNSELIFDDDGRWIDFEYDKDESGLKVKQLHQFLEKHGYQLSDCVAVGDGESDVGLFQIIPGIAVHSDYDHLKEIAWQTTPYIARITQMIESAPDTKTS